MDDRPQDPQGPPGTDPDDVERRPDQLLEAARAANRFSREFLATVVALVTTAFGVVVALAWNTALSKALESLSHGAQVVGLVIYAIVVTVFAVVTIIVLGRLAGRIGADPVQFTYPAPRKD
jgi:tetrahydromethanopterin S-methyltransferase subunit E